MLIPIFRSWGALRHVDVLRLVCLAAPLHTPFAAQVEQSLWHLEAAECVYPHEFSLLKGSSLSLFESFLSAGSWRTSAAPDATFYVFVSQPLFSHHRAQPCIVGMPGVSENCTDTVGAVRASAPRIRHLSMLDGNAAILTLFMFVLSDVT